MKQKSILLAVLLLMLFVTPMIFTSPYVSAVYGDESPQSIPSFTETLPDDVLFYPDQFDDDIANTANCGTFTGSSEVNDWTATQVKDGTVWRSTVAPYDMELEFFGPDGLIGFDYALYITTSGGGDNPEYYFYDFTGSAYVKIGDISSDSWHNGTTYNLDYISSSYDVEIKIECEAGETAYWDYAELKFHVMHLADSDHYAESFADVSDWTTSDTSITTDDDVATITENGAGATGRAYISFSSKDFFEYYYEFRIESMTATTANLEFWDGDSYETLKTFTVAGTYKGIISDTDATTMSRIGFLVGSESGNVLVDYLRISLANESGWQHDGSTTEGVTEVARDGWSYDISSDGDKLSVNMSRSAGTSDYGAVWIEFDTSTTEADLERDYYPFFAISWEMTVFTGNYMYGRVFIDGKTATTAADYFGGGTKTGTWSALDRQNTAPFTTSAGTDEGVFLVVKGDSGEYGTLEIDWVKAYSIANFTVTQLGTSVDDILYVDSNILYCSGTSFTSITVDHDPALDLSLYRDWTMNTSSGIPEVDFYDGGWLGYSNETAGELLPWNTVTDVRLKFTDNANIISLMFFDAVTWQIEGVAIIPFSVPFEEWGFQVALIILGLCMIPGSTLYLAYGIKHDRSSNRLFYGLIAFILGFGLLVAGVMP